MRNSAKVLTKDEINRKYKGLSSHESYITYHALDLGYEIAFIENEKLENSIYLGKDATKLLQKIFPKHKIYFVYFTDTRDAKDGRVYFAFYKEKLRK